MSCGLIQVLVQAGFDPVYGARPLKRAIQQKLENPLAQKILSGDFEPGSTMKALTMVAALESGRIRIVDGRVDLDPERWGHLRDVHPPYTLQGLIASRLDRLDTADQLVLRMAAVIGNEFTLEALRALVPEEVGDALQALQRVHAAGFLQRAAIDGDAAFASATRWSGMPPMRAC